MISLLYIKISEDIFHDIKTKKFALVAHASENNFDFNKVAV